MDDVDISSTTGGGMGTFMHAGTSWMSHVHEMLVLLTGRKKDL